MQAASGKSSRTILINTATDTTALQSSIFKDCVARRLLGQSALSDAASGTSVPDKQPTGDSDTTSDLDDFTSYLASEIWDVLPPKLQTLSHENPSVDEHTLNIANIPISFTDTLVSYRIVPDSDAAGVFLNKTLADYVEEVCAPPPVWTATRTSECEICEREVPLTYHHLIPRSTHSKVLKRKWHPESLLHAVAWLCR